MNNKIQYDIFDLIKFIMSIVVVAIHAHPLGEYHYLIYPWARIAVPTFFLISAYLFFLNMICKIVMLTDICN